jgi:dipeptidase E
MRLLLLSNSRVPERGFLDHAEDWIREHLGSEVKTIAFVPYAGVTIPLDDYAGMVRKRLEPLGYRVESVHSSPDPAGTVRDADAVAVGGGNTWRLLELMYANDVLAPIHSRVTDGVPFIGWSAGANVACPTIRTTNDMSIVTPPTVDALGFVPFQINTHYMDANPEGHQGETREQRILELVEVNPDVTVVGLREGSALRVLDRSIGLLGNKPARIFRKGDEPREHPPGQPLDSLLG